MKILLDENISDSLINILNDHKVESVKTMKWLSKRNGELLGLAVFNGFDVFVTRDQNLQYQQNLSKFDLAIVVIKNKMRNDMDLPELFDKLKNLLDNKLSKGVSEIS